MADENTGICYVEESVATKGFTTEQLTTLHDVALFCAILSFCGSAFITFSYWRFPSLRTMLYKLIVFLSIADMFSSISYVLGALGSFSSCPGFFCLLTAAITQWFDMSTFCWTACIAFNIHKVLVEDMGETVREYVKYYKMFSWGLPFCIMLLVANSGAFGDAGNWCWIKQEYVFTRLFAFYFPLIAIIIYDTVIYTKVVKSVAGTSQRKAIAFRLRLYLLVFIVTKTTATINRVQNILFPDSPVFILYLLHSICTPLMGFFNCIVYGCNSHVISTWRRSAMCKRNPFCRKNVGEEGLMNEDEVAMISSNASGGI